MLQFFKNKNRKPDEVGDSSSISNSLNKHNDDLNDSPCDNEEFIDNEFIFNENTLNDIEKKLDSLDDKEEHRSQLTKNLLEILTDKNCLCYFIQYLETKKALPIIKLWLDIENFKIASRITDNNFKKSPSNPINNLCNNEQKKESPSIITSNSNNDNDLKKKQILNKCKSLDNFSIINDKLLLTDDEKSNLYNDDNKIINDNNIKILYKQYNNDNIIIIDSIRIYRKYFINNSIYYIDDIPLMLKKNLSIELCYHINNNNTNNNNDLDDNKNFINIINLYDLIQSFVYEKIEKNYLNTFFNSCYYCKYCIDILNTNNLNLYDILYSELSIFYFMEFLEQEKKQIYLEFWLTILNYKKLHNGINNSNLNNTNNSINDIATIKSDAMIIYNKYILLSNKLNISNKLINIIDNCINTLTNNRIHLINSFDIIIKIIELYLKKNYLEKFLKSKLYKKLLNELFNRINLYNQNNNINSSNINSNVNNNNCDKLIIKKTTLHKKSLSDVTSKNTLLAMDQTFINKNKLLHQQQQTTTNNSDMQIDSRQLYNPDLLWYRRYSANSKSVMSTTTTIAPSTSTNRLSFGRVNELGRYERDFDLQPTINETNNQVNLQQQQLQQQQQQNTLNNIILNLESNDQKWSLKNAVKKFVNMKEDNIQEELAWQVAEMIVKDITDITLNNNT